MATDYIGQTLNERYKITERIGVGGMAEVYRAQDLVLGRTVAVKIMLPQYAQDTSFTQKFKQEAASAANLSSPYIVNVYDWGHDNGTYYIVMEYVRGTDLKTGITNRGAINQRKVAEIGSQVCQALTAAHNLDIIHCDIKPQNIMIQPDGNVKVMDFGISKAKNSLELKSSTVLGTAHYISPEQAQGKDLTAASDIYSLGVVLYEAATGQLPFDGPDAVSVATMQVRDEPMLPGDINPNLDERLEAIILKAMQKDPKKRYASAQDMRAALNDFLANRKSATGAETTVFGGIPDAADTVSGGTVGMTAVLPVSKQNTRKNGGAYNTGSMQQVNRYSNNRRDDDQKPSGTRRGFIIGAVVAVVVVVLAAIFLLKGCSGGAEEVTVPNVTGKSAAEATLMLKEAGLVVGTTDKSYDSDAPSGTVIKQSPEANSHVAAGSKVNLVVSLGAEEVIVPDLHNKTAAEAQKLLAEAGLIPYAGEAKYSSEIAANKIIEQEPKAGETVKKGEIVTYVLSLGTENIAVENVVGRSESDAKAKLEGDGFKVTVTYQYSDTVANGVVISQNPNGGKLEKGGTVALVVSQGQDPAKAPVAIPDVTHKLVPEAKSTLEAAGFTVSFDGPNDDNAMVIGMSPTGSAVKGTNIVLTTETAIATEPSPEN